MDAILVKGQLCLFALQSALRSSLLVSLDVHRLHGWCLRLDSCEAAIVDSNRAQGTPGSTSRPRCDCHDGWMWSSHCSNMSILVGHCLALSHRCVCSKQQQQQPVSSVCALWPFAHKRERIHGGHVFPRSQHVFFHWVKTATLRTFPSPTL